MPTSVLNLLICVVNVLTVYPTCWLACVCVQLLHKLPCIMCVWKGHTIITIKVIWDDWHWLFPAKRRFIGTWSSYIHLCSLQSCQTTVIKNSDFTSQNIGIDLPLLWSGSVFVTLLIYHNGPDWAGALGQAAQVIQVNVTSLRAPSEHAIPNLHQCQCLMQNIHKQLFYIFVSLICNVPSFSASHLVTCRLHCPPHSISHSV